MPLLISQPAKTPRALNDRNRKSHEIDQHIRVYVVDKPNMMPGDETNHNYLVTDKSSENYECTTVSGIQPTYNVIVFRNESEGGEVNTNQTVYLRDGFCSCNNCRKATVPEDFLTCRYEKNDVRFLICYLFMRSLFNIFLIFNRYLDDMGPLRRQTFQNKGFRKEPPIERRVEEYRVHLSAGGTIIHGEMIVVGLQGGNIGMVTVIPEVIEKKCQRNNKSFVRGNVVIMVDVLEKAPFVNVEEGLNTTSRSTQDYIRSNDRLLRSRPILLSDVILPTLRHGVSRSDLIRCEVLDPTERIRGLDVYRLQLQDLELLRERENEIFPCDL